NDAEQHRYQNPNTEIFEKFFHNYAKDTHFFEIFSTFVIETRHDVTIYIQTRNPKRGSAGSKI
ncbi:MAG: hypothetical protein IIW59_05515, partial [Alistipes sp.]|nr:hypothetical protein [Alistipes sp.]